MYPYGVLDATARSLPFTCREVRRSNLRSRKSIRSVRITVEQNGARSGEQDPNVEPEGPMVDIIFVELDTALRALDRTDFAAQTFHLGIAGDPGLHSMAAGIAAHRFVVETVADHHLRPVGPGANERHAALEHVEQLRQLIDAEAAQEATDRSYARVVAGCSLLRTDIGHVGVHCPEFEDVDRFIVEADARLDEQYRSGAGH